MSYALNAVAEQADTESDTSSDYAEETAEATEEVNTNDPTAPAVSIIWAHQTNKGKPTPWDNPNIKRCRKPTWVDHR